MWIWPVAKGWGLSPWLQRGAQQRREREEKKLQQKQKKVPTGMACLESVSLPLHPEFRIFPDLTQNLRFPQISPISLTNSSQTHSKRFPHHFIPPATRSFPPLLTSSSECVNLYLAPVCMLGISGMCIQEDWSALGSESNAGI